VRGASQRRSERGAAAMGVAGEGERGQYGCRIERRGVRVLNMASERTRRRVLRCDEWICEWFTGQRGRE
jgi:hypothetical protein